MQITYAPGPESVASAWLALQRALPQLDRRFGFLFWWEQGQLRLEVRGAGAVLLLLDRPILQVATHGAFRAAVATGRATLCVHIPYSALHVRPHPACPGLPPCREPSLERWRRRRRCYLTQGCWKGWTQTAPTHRHSRT